MKHSYLKCTKCHKVYPVNLVYPRCDVCNEPLELANVDKGSITKGDWFTQNILERYSDFFPFTTIHSEISLHEGFTSLTEVPKFAEELNIKKILLKNETQNPTWSFKDRGTVAGIEHAVSLGYRKIGTVSTGNMAASVAAYGVRSNLTTYILVNTNIAEEKINPIAIYNPLVIKVEGNYSDLYYKSFQIGDELGIYFINSDVPFRVEGSKTIAFEICEQMNFEVPDFVIVPTSSGSNLRGILKGFEEFKICGLIDRIPKMVCSQAIGCSPIYNAFINNAECVSRVENPNTIAHAIDNPYPPSGNEVLRQLRAQDGIAVAVTDEEIMASQQYMAKSGIFSQPESAVPLAAAKKLRMQGEISKDSIVVCVVTGGGLKYTSILNNYKYNVFSTELKNLPDFFEHINNIT